MNYYSKNQLFYHKTTLCELRDVIVKNGGLEKLSVF